MLMHGRLQCSVFHSSYDNCDKLLWAIHLWGCHLAQATAAVQVCVQINMSECDLDADSEFQRL